MNNDINDFVNYLKGNGYPSNSIIFNKRIGKYCFDILIFDSLTNKYLASFEIKNGSFLENDKLKYSEQLKAYRQAIEEVIEFILVVVNGKGYEFYYLSVDNKLVKVQLPEFLILKNNAINKELITKEIERRNLKSYFLVTCQILSALPIIYLIFDIIYFDKNDKTIISIERLTLLGAFILLNILPYLESLKALGVEIKILKENK